MLEQEVKLAFASPEAARQSIQSTGARLVVSRRLLDDALYDTAEGHLRQAGTALRVRRDGRGGSGGVLTFKGPVQAGPVKSREEIETPIGDAALAGAILEGAGFRCWFRAQKYREEYDLGGAHVALDETPMGTFVEIEGPPDVIARVASLLGRSAGDYRLESYPRLYREWCEARGVAAGDMLFGNA